MTRVLTVEQTAELLQLTPKTTRDLLRRGRLPGRKVGKAWRILESELESYLGAAEREQAGQRVSAFGICADIAGLSSEEFMRRKQEEIDVENRRSSENSA